MDKKWRWLVYATPLILAFMLWRKLIFAPGVPLFGEFPATINPLFTAKELIHGWSSYLGFGFSPIGWPESLGGGNAFGTMPVSTQSFWLFFRSIFAIFGQSGNLIYLLLGTMLPFWTMFVWAKDIFKNNRFSFWGAYAAAFFYTVNPQVVIRTAVGTFRYHYAHALLPLVLWSFHRAVNTEGNTRRLYIILCTLCIGIIAFIVPHLLVLALPLMLFEIIARHFFVSHQKTVNSLLTLAIVFAGGVGLMFGPLLASKLWPGELITPLGQFFSLSSLSLGGPIPDMFGKMLRLFGTDSIGQIDWYAKTLWLLPILAICGAYLSKRRLAWFWVIVSLVAVFMATGVNEPLSSFKTWLFLNLPGMSAFRDPSKFLELTQLGYSILLGWFFIGLLEKKWLGLDTALLSIIGLSLVWSAHWVTGDLKGRLQQHTVPEIYIDNTLQGRVATKPSPGYLTELGWYTQTGGTTSTQENPLSFYSPNKNIELVSVATPRNNRSYRFVRYWLNITEQNSRSFNYLSAKAATTQLLTDEQTQNSQHIEPINITNSEKTTLSSHALITVGNWKTLNKLAEKELDPLVPIIFAWDLNWSQWQDIKKKPGLNYIFDNTKPEDLAAYLLQKEWAIETNQFTWNGLRSQKQWMMAESLADDWQKIGIPFISGHSLLADTGATIELPLTGSGHRNNTNNNNLLLIRVLEEGRPFSLKIELNNQPAQIITHTKDDNFVGRYEKTSEGIARWHIIPLPVNIQSTSLTVEEGSVTIDGLSMVPVKVYEEALSIIKSSINSDNSFDSVNNINLQSNTNIIESQTVGGEIELTESPGSQDWLTVRESYHPLWRLGNERPLVADGFAQLYPPTENSRTNIVKFIPHNKFYYLMLANYIVWVILLSYAGILAIKEQNNKS